MSNKLEIFVLEDSEDRIKWFLKEFNDCNVTIATNANDGISIIKEKRFDIIALDHDLEFFKNDPQGLGFCPSDYFNTGYTVAKIIPDSINKKALIIIHSLNPVGASNIHTLLPQAHRMMFGTFKRSTFIKNK